IRPCPTRSIEGDSARHRANPTPVGSRLASTRRNTSPATPRFGGRWTGQAPWNSEAMSASSYDAVVVGSGPNGLTAAITLARAGLGVLVVEAAGTPGGGLRSEESTLPGFIHDTCATVHTVAAASPILRTLPLHEYGLEWVHPPTPVAHP